MCQGYIVLCFYLVIVNKITLKLKPRELIGHVTWSAAAGSTSVPGDWGSRNYFISVQGFAHVETVNKHPLYAYFKLFFVESLALSFSIEQVFKMRPLC